MTLQERAIVTAFTGCCMICDEEWSHYYQYIETLLGRKVLTHHLAKREVMEEIKAKSYKDFEALCIGKTQGDLMPVVRCKDCKWFSKDDLFGTSKHWCERISSPGAYCIKVEEDDFCSYGSRKEQG